MCHTQSDEQLNAFRLATVEQTMFRESLRQRCLTKLGQIHSQRLDAEPHLVMGRLLGEIYREALAPMRGYHMDDGQIDALVDRLAIAFVAVQSSAGLYRSEPAEVAAICKALEIFQLDSDHIAREYFADAVRQAREKAERYPDQRDDDEALLLEFIVSGTNSTKLALSERLREHINQLSLLNDLQVAV